MRPEINRIYQECFNRHKCLGDTLTVSFIAVTADPGWWNLGLVKSTTQNVLRIYSKDSSTGTMGSGSGYKTNMDPAKIGVFAASVPTTMVMGTATVIAHEIWESVRWGGGILQEDIRIIVLWAWCFLQMVVKPSAKHSVYCDLILDSFRYVTGLSLSNAKTK